MEKFTQVKQKHQWYRQNDVLYDGVLDLLDVNDYGLEIDKNNKCFSYTLAVIDNFFKFGRTVTLNNQNAQSPKVSSKKIPFSWKGKPNDWDW